MSELVRCVPPDAYQSGYHWVRRWRGSAAIPLHWNATWHRNKGNGWGSWAQPDREDQWEYLGPCPSPDDSRPSPSEDVAAAESAELTTLRDERDRLRADLKTHVDATEANENRIIDAEFKATEMEHRALTAEAALAQAREECAKIVEGRVYKTRYREWPEWGTGNRSNDCETTKFADAIAAAIRARAALIGTDGWREIDEKTPSDIEVHLGWWETWPERKWRQTIDLWHSTKGGHCHGQATHYRPLPSPPSGRETTGDAT
jgi:hypothetical protein